MMLSKSPPPHDLRHPDIFCCRLTIQVTLEWVPSTAGACNGGEGTKAWNWPPQSSENGWSLTARSQPIYFYITFTTQTRGHFHRQCNSWAQISRPRAAYSCRRKGQWSFSLLIYCILQYARNLPHEYVYPCSIFRWASDKYLYKIEKRCFPTWNATIHPALRNAQLLFNTVLWIR